MLFYSVKCEENSLKFNIAPYGERAKFANLPNRPCKSTKKIKVAERKWHSTFLSTENFSFHGQHFFSCINPILLCDRVLNRDRVVILFIFLGHFYVFDRKLVKGHSHLTKWNFYRVEVSPFLIKFYGIDFASELLKNRKLWFCFHLQKCW